jgi:hypothetical protein
MIGEDHEPALPPVGATRADGFAGWLREGWRSALGCRVRWENLRAGPAFVLALIAAEVILAVALQRLLIEGPASFWWYGLSEGWWVSLALLWLCWVVAASPPGAATVFALLQMQWLVIGLATGVVSVMATRSQALAGRCRPGPCGLSGGQRSSGGSPRPCSCFGVLPRRARRRAG